MFPVEPVSETSLDRRHSSGASSERVEAPALPPGLPPPRSLFSNRNLPSSPDRPAARGGGGEEGGWWAREGCPVCEATRREDRDRAPMRGSAVSGQIVG